MRDEKKPRLIFFSNPVRPSSFYKQWMDEDGILRFGGGRQGGKTAAKDDAAFQRFMAKVLHV